MCCTEPLEKSATSTGCAPNKHSLHDAPAQPSGAALVREKVPFIMHTPTHRNVASWRRESQALPKSAQLRWCILLRDKQVLSEQAESY